MNIFVLSGALLLFDRKIHMENSSIKRVLCAGEGGSLKYIYQSNISSGTGAVKCISSPVIGCRKRR